MILPLLFIILGLSWFLSSLGVYLRDVSHVIGIVLMVMMFMTPIFYSISALPEKYRGILRMNPLATLVEQAQNVMIWGRSIDWSAWSLVAVISVAIAYLGFAWFQKQEVDLVMSSEIAISVDGVSKRYEMYSKPRDRLLQFFSSGSKQYYKEFWALQKISFDVKKGETLGILGRNGSGKSTLLQIIAGTLTPTTGSVHTSGVLAALLELGSGFNPEFTGRENIYLNGVILGFSRQEMDQRLEEIISFADIGDHLDQPIKTYSSGMTVRLAFAVQACVSPQVLIVDEALSVGDEKFQRKCFEYIEKLRKGGCSILLVTHSTATVEKFCQRGFCCTKVKCRA